MSYALVEDRGKGERYVLAHHSDKRILGTMRKPLKKAHPSHKYSIVVDSRAEKMLRNPRKGRAGRRKNTTPVEFIVDRMHVGTPDAEVRAEIRRRAERGLADGSITRKQLASWVKQAIRRHHANKKLYSRVMGGSNPRVRSSHTHTHRIVLNNPLSIKQAIERAAKAVKSGGRVVVRMLRTSKNPPQYFVTRRGKHPSEFYDERSAREYAKEKAAAGESASVYRHAEGKKKKIITYFAKPK